MDVKHTLGLLVTVFLWSISFIWTKGALDYLSPVLLVGLRIMVAVVCLGVYMLISGKGQKVSGRDLRTIAILGMVEPVGYFLFETAGVDYVSPTLACIIIALIPIITPIFWALTSGERVSGREWLSLAVCMAGVALVVMGDNEPISGRIIGVLLLLGAVAAAIVQTLVIKNLSDRLNSVTIVTWQYVFAAIYMIPIVLTTRFAEISTLTFQSGWVVNVLILGLFCSCVSFILYADSVRFLGVMRTSMFVNLMPSLTAVASFMILGEMLSSLKIVGIALTIVGLMISMVKTKNGEIVPD